MSRDDALTAIASLSGDGIGKRDMLPPHLQAPTPRRLRLFAAGLPALLAATAACVSLQPVAVGEVVELGPDQGILVLHTSSNTSIVRLKSLNGGTFEDIPEGHQINLFVASAGAYTWRNIDVSGTELPGFAPPRFRFKANEKWRFRVEPGQISYGGMLELVYSDWSLLEARNLDRSALVLDFLRRRYPALLDRYPLAYTGRARNVFFDNYRRAMLGRHAEEITRRPAPESEATLP